MRISLLIIFLLAAVNFELMSQEDTMPPVPRWKLGCDGNVIAATVSDKPDDPLIVSNLKIVEMIDDESDNYKFEFQPFTPGQVKTTTWRLLIIDPSADAKAVLHFEDMAGNDTTITIEYTSIKFQIEPDYYYFGKVKPGDYPEKEFTVRNLSDHQVILNKLAFLFDNQNFEIIADLPQILDPDQTYKFTVRFISDNKGIFSDSIGVGDTCVFYYKSEVRALVGGAEITARDADFGNVAINNTETRQIEIKNNGIVDLRIHGYDGPVNSVFSHDLGQLSEQNPLRIRPDSSYFFEVRFTPDDTRQYSDSIVFQSNADIEDNITILNGRGYDPGFIAKGYDFGRRRINIPGHPAGPYISTEGGIILENPNIEPVRITGYSITSDINGSAFTFDDSMLNGFTIDPGESDTITVEFLPVQAGTHELVLSIENENNLISEARIYGIGTIAKPVFPDAEFEGTLINSQQPGEPLQPVRITNESWEVDGIDVSDSMIITQFDVLPAGNEISKDGTNFGTEGFRFDENALEHSSGASVSLPVVLKPGEYIELNADFTAQHPGQHTAQLQAMCNGMDNPVSEWTGTALQQDVLIYFPDNMQGCAGGVAYFDAYIENTGTSDIEIDTVYLADPGGIFFIQPTQFKSGFDLQEGKTESFQLGFSPADDIAYGNEIIFESSRGNSFRKSFQAAGVLDPVETIAETEEYIFTGESGMLSPGGRLDYRINLVEPVPQEYRIEKFEAVFRYDNRIFEESFNDAGNEYSNIIKAGKDFKNIFNLNGIDISEIDQGNNISEVSATFSANPGEFINGTGEIVEISMFPLLPAHAADTGGIVQLELRFEHDLYTLECPDCCVDFTSDAYTTKLEACIGNLRQLELSDSQYGISRLSPNPVSTGDLDLEYSVAFSGDCDIEIFNSYGEKVLNIYQSGIEKGIHKLHIDVTEFNSGVYYVRMKSGVYSGTKKFVIAK